MYKTAWSLLQGGADKHNNLVSAELYDPASRTWAVTGSLNPERYAHTVTLLQDGNLLVAGGLRENGLVLASAEVGHGHR